jgi:hypothetical protein
VQIIEVSFRVVQQAGEEKTSARLLMLSAQDLEDSERLAGYLAETYSLSEEDCLAALEDRYDELLTSKIAADAPLSLRPGQKSHAEGSMAKYDWIKGSGITKALSITVEKGEKKLDFESGVLATTVSTEVLMPSYSLHYETPAEAATVKRLQINTSLSDRSLGQESLAIISESHPGLVSDGSRLSQAMDPMEFEDAFDDFGYYDDGEYDDDPIIAEANAVWATGEAGDLDNGQDYRNFASMIDFYDNDSYTPETPYALPFLGQDPGNEDRRLAAALEAWRPVEIESNPIPGSTFDSVSANALCGPTSSPSTGAGHVSVPSAAPRIPYGFQGHEDSLMSDAINFSNWTTKSNNFGYTSFPLTPSLKDKDPNRFVSSQN